ncbi:MAG: glycosyltransferase [Leptolyngbyaceae cyanobacterium RM2_2_4]|nr:glycosyltransferase [Leptolyngbyaceae cyanobacterium SM1_4_3]NJN91151.1 glycosyltransferase [Leptolyngbyaceae cyanobacterium SL_5_14]NJO49004.1 glycosyltransferase [Leptolyngbyaceae cyanobacterium RM2_2_4]
MTHFGILCLGGTGHLNTLLPLGDELKRRGHQVTVLSETHGEAKVKEAGLNFEAIAYTGVDPKRAELTGLRALYRGISFFKVRVANSLRETPVAIRKTGIEVLLVDMSAFEGGTIAEHLRLPFITICSALVLYEDNDVPPALTDWTFNSAWWARLRNQIAYWLLLLIARPVVSVIARHRKLWNLPAYSSYNDCFSKLAIISQHVPELEYPYRKLPPYFHFTGPFHSSTGRPNTDFPFEKLSNLPLIYVSLGTSRNRIKHLFQVIAEACVDLEAQVVISLGGGLEPEALPKLTGNPILVKYAPQLELLKRATLCITHAGLNTTLEALSNAVPLVAIPLADDQLGVAARLTWTGVGEFLPLSSVTIARLRQVIRRVLLNGAYKQNAIRLQKAIRYSGGVQYAADVIESKVAESHCIEQQAQPTASLLESNSIIN